MPEMVRSVVAPNGRRVRLTTMQRYVAGAIQQGGQVRICQISDDDPDAHYILMHADPADPIGISMTQRIQTRTLLPLRWMGLLDELWETPIPVEVH